MPGIGLLSSNGTDTAVVFAVVTDIVVVFVKFSTVDGVGLFTSGEVMLFMEWFIGFNTSLNFSLLK